MSKILEEGLVPVPVTQESQEIQEFRRKAISGSVSSNRRDRSREMITRPVKSGIRIKGLRLYARSLRFQRPACLEKAFRGWSII